MRYYIERYYPIIIAIVFAIFFYLYQNRIDNLDDAIKGLLESALAICGALLGFLLTILTLINTINTRRMRFVREGGHLPRLYRYLRIALFLDIVSISIDFILPILFSIKYFKDEKDLIYTILVFVISYTWLANIRFSYMFIKLLTDPKPEQ